MAAEERLNRVKRPFEDRECGDEPRKTKIINVIFVSCLGGYNSTRIVLVLGF